MLGIQELYQATETDSIYNNGKGNTNKINIRKKCLNVRKSGYFSSNTNVFERKPEKRVIYQIWMKQIEIR